MASRIQLHLELPFKRQPREHPRIRGFLDRGYRIAQLQRITDKEVVITLDPPAETRAGQATSAK